jgi:hypothetical protein
MNIQPTPLRYKVPTRIDDNFFGCTFEYSHTGIPIEKEFVFCRYANEIIHVCAGKDVYAIYTKVR